jgi:hypothetical protein
MNIVLLKSFNINHKLESCTLHCPDSLENVICLLYKPTTTSWEGRESLDALVIHQLS